MSLLLVIVHIVVCVALIMIVLLQTGKGADMGAAFGGGSSQTLFGSTGASTFLSKATTGVAVVFMITCMSLAYLSTNRISSSIIMEDATPVGETTPETDVKTVPVETTTGEQPGETSAGDQTATTEGGQPASATSTGDQPVGTTTDEQPVNSDENPSD